MLLHTPGHGVSPFPQPFPGLEVPRGVGGGGLTSSSSRTTSVLPQRAASCSAVPALVCRLMSMPACSRSLRANSGVRETGERGENRHCPPCPRHPPDDVDVAVLGSEVQGAGAVGVGGVPRLGLQQRRAHVAVQEQLDHLPQQTDGAGLQGRLSRLPGLRPPGPRLPSLLYPPPAARDPPLPSLPGAALCPPPPPPKAAPAPQGPRCAPILSQSSSWGSQHCKDLPRPGQTRTPGPGASSPNCP